MRILVIFILASLNTCCLAKMNRKYAVFAAMDAEEKVDAEFCLQYYPHFRNLSPDLDSAKITDFAALADLTSVDTCADFDATSVKDKFALVQDKNCSILQKALNINKEGGLGLFSSPRVNLSQPEEIDNLDALVAIFVKNSNFWQVVNNEKQWKSFAIFAPPNESRVFDPSIILLFSLAVFTVALGSRLAGIMHKQITKYQGSQANRERSTSATGAMERSNDGVDNDSYHSNDSNDTNEANANGSNNGSAENDGNVEESNNSSSSSNNNNQHSNDENVGPNGSRGKEIEGTMHVTPWKVFIYVCIMCLVLMLLYLFVSVLVYVVMGMFMLASAFAFYTISIELINYLFPSLPKCQIQSCTQWFPTELLSLVILILAIAINVVWFINRKNDPIGWILQDFLAVLFSLNLLRYCRLPSFKICFILMSLLFVYDIFFVFLTPLFTKDGESVMVEVATGGNSGEQLPMVLKSPKLSYSPLQACTSFNYSLLGLGDILVPGLVISYGHVYDIIHNTRCHVYWLMGNFFYALSLIATFVALHLMQTAQPALLYIVPVVLITLSLTALARREFGAFWKGGQPKSGNDGNDSTSGSP